MISDLLLNEFKEICHQELGADFDDDVARELAERHLAAFKVIYRPIPSIDIKQETK